MSVSDERETRWERRGKWTRWTVNPSPWSSVTRLFLTSRPLISLHVSHPSPHLTPRRGEPRDEMSGRVAWGAAGFLSRRKTHDGTVVTVRNGRTEWGCEWQEPSDRDERDSLGSSLPLPYRPEGPWPDGMRRGWTEWMTRGYGPPYCFRSPRSLTSFHSLHYVHAPFHSVPNEVRDERPSRVMRTGKEREWTRLTAQHLQSYRSDWWPFPAVSMSSTHLLHLSHVGSYPPFLIPFVSLRYASLLSLHSFRREPTSLWGGDTTEVSVRWEVAERYTSLYARLTYGPSVLCSSRVALRVPLRSRLRRVRWGEIENEWVTRSEGTSERSTHRCALSLTVHPSVTRHSVRPLVPRLLTSFLVPTVWRVEDVRSRGGRTEHRPDENRRNDWDTSPTVPAVYRSLRSLPSLLTSLHSCRSLMLHSLLSFHSWGEGNGTERGVNRTELSGMRGAKGRGKVIRKGCTT